MFQKTKSKPSEAGSILKGGAAECVCIESKDSMQRAWSLLRRGQAKKSARGMPWHQEPMKVVISCDKPRGAAHKRYIRGSLNGATRHGLYRVNHR